VLARQFSCSRFFRFDAAIRAMDEIAYRRAKARVEQQLAFYRHLVLYLIVNAFLFALNLFYWNGYLWAKWPAFGWGIGIIVHGMETFSYRWGGPRKESMIQREMERQRRAESNRPASV
jgi:hypothetical protein